MTVNIGDRIRITARMEFGGVNDVQNVYHVSGVGGASETDANFMAAIALFLDTQYTIINPFISNTITYLDVLGFNITQNLPLPPIGWPTLVGGAGGGDATSPQVSPTVFWRTSRARSIARKFLPLGSELDVAAGILSTAFLAALANYGVAFVGGIPMGLLNVRFITLNLITGLTATYENALVPVDTRTQRRRRRGVGA